jgi:hypothetical protein
MLPNGLRFRDVLGKIYSTSNYSITQNQVTGAWSTNINNPLYPYPFADADGNPYYVQINIPLTPLDDVSAYDETVPHTPNPGPLLGDPRSPWAGQIITQAVWEYVDSGPFADTDYNGPDGSQRIVPTWKWTYIYPMYYTNWLNANPIRLDSTLHFLAQGTLEGGIYVGSVLAAAAGGAELIAESSSTVAADTAASQAATSAIVDDLPSIIVNSPPAINTVIASSGVVADSTAAAAASGLSVASVVTTAQGAIQSAAAAVGLGGAVERIVNPPSAPKPPAPSMLSVVATPPESAPQVGGLDLILLALFTKGWILK